MENLKLEDSAKIYALTMNKKRMAMFRFSVYLKEKIIPELLQTALDSTIKRFPSFGTKVEKNFFDYYLAQSNYHIEIKEDINSKFRQMNTFDTNTHCLRVLYWNNRISAEFFHILTDGAGAIEFLKVLVSEYLKLIGINFEIDENIMNIKETSNPQEYENAFDKVPHNVGRCKLSDKKAIQLDGKLLKNYASYNVIFNMETSKLKSVAEKYNSTITVYLLSLMFIACKKASSKSDGDINIQVPINIRKYYETKTVKNFSMYCGIRLPISEINDLSSIIDKIKQQLLEKTSKSYIEKMVTHIRKISNKIKYAPLFVKKPIAKIGFELYGERVFTNTLSNIGIINLPSGMSENIKNVEGIIYPQNYNRAGCLAITCNNITTFSINKRTNTSTFENEIKNLLEKDGLQITIQDQ